MLVFLCHNSLDFSLSALKSGNVAMFLLQVDLDVVEQACEKLIADDCMPAQVHDICQSVDSKLL
jgi:hypothetical protein